MSKKLASSPTIEGIKKMISRYFFCEPEDLDISVTGNVIKKGKTLQYFKVSSNGKIFYFEEV